MKRLPDESFEDYKKRRAEEQAKTKEKLKPWRFWNSAKWGTYQKKDNEVYDEYGMPIIYEAR